MRRYTKEERIGLLNQYKKSNETLSGFALKNNISKGTLSYWIGKNNKVKVSSADMPSFLPIQLSDINKSNSIGVIRVMKDNIIIELPMEVSPDYLKTILGW